MTPKVTCGGDIVGAVLAAHGVPAVFTLCGGHISPVLLGAKRSGLRIIDVRDEASAVFAADALGRLTGVPGVAAVTAGPGVTNTITAVASARLAQSAVVVLGGATATMLRGRGALQDVDQISAMRPHVKWAGSCRRVRDLTAVLARAFRIAREGVPGPVFVELPVDLLYPESLVRDWYTARGSTARPSLGDRALALYLDRHVERLFAGATESTVAVEPSSNRSIDALAIERAAAFVSMCERPVLLVGSQVAIDPSRVDDLVTTIERLGMPVYLSGMARGLMGRTHPLLVRHRRKEALRGADLVVLAGVPCDFRVDYGRHIARKAVLVAGNLDRDEMTKNRKPTVAALGPPAELLRALAGELPSHDDRWQTWRATLRQRDVEREREMNERPDLQTALLDPLRLCRAIDDVLTDDSTIIVDGGDFAATASYIVSPRGPLRWLDPGVFGTLGAGGGFALGAKLARPASEVWILYGDGAAAYSLAEFDSFVRHGLPVIAVVGNDAGWTQIARDQVGILGDDVGTVLRRTDYHMVAIGFGGRGASVDNEDDLPSVLVQARDSARQGVPFLVNAHLGKSDFRRGSLSI